MRAWIIDFAKQRLVGRIASAQGMEADMLMGKVDIATHQAMQPMLGDMEAAAEQIDVAVLVAATQEDHAAGQGRAQVESEAGREAAAPGSSLAPGGGFSAVSGDVTRRNVLQGGHVAAVMTAATPWFATVR